MLVPYNADRVGLYDPSTDAWTQGKDSLAAAGAKTYVGVVLLPDGRVVLVPFSADHVGLYDPSMDAWRRGILYSVAALSEATGALPLPYYNKH